MDRRTFTGLTAAALFTAPQVLRARSPKHVTVIGAGSAGLTAAYHLKKAGIKVQVLEASRNWGGRMKRLKGFADVPLDLGAEWIHDDPEIFGQILGKGSSDLGVDTIIYQPQTYQFWNRGKLRNFNAARHAYQEVKFKDTTWYGFFEKFLLPSIRSSIRTNAPVAGIQSSPSGLTVRLSNGQEIETDKVLLTVPLSVLQREQIAFETGLGPRSVRDLKRVDFGSGFKAFLSFKDRFYPDMLFEGPRSSVLADTWSEKLYYDALWGKGSRQNVLGLFTVSDGKLPRAGMDDQTLLKDILAELTEIFGPVVTQSYKKGVVQNWSRAPHILGSYSMTNRGNRDIASILAPKEGKLFYAGEALGDDAQSTVQGAAFSAIEAVEQMLAS